MRIWTAFWTVVVAVLAAFVVANWPALAAQTTVHLILTTVTAPLGLIMLGVVLGLSVMFLVFLVWLETRAIVELGRAGRQASSASSDALDRHLTTLEQQVSGLRTETGEAVRDLVERLGHVEQVVKEEVGRTTASAPHGVTGLA